MPCYLCISSNDRKGRSGKDTLHQLSYETVIPARLSSRPPKVAVRVAAPQALVAMNLANEGLRASSSTQPSSIVVDGVWDRTSDHPSNSLAREIASQLCSRRNQVVILHGLQGAKKAAVLHEIVHAVLSSAQAHIDMAARISGAGYTPFAPLPPPSPSYGAVSTLRSRRRSSVSFFDLERTSHAGGHPPLPSKRRKSSTQSKVAATWKAAQEVEHGDDSPVVRSTKRRSQNVTLHQRFTTKVRSEDGEAASRRNTAASLAASRKGTAASLSSLREQNGSGSRRCTLVSQIDQNGSESGRQAESRLRSDSLKPHPPSTRKPAKRLGTLNIDSGIPSPRPSSSSRSTRSNMFVESSAGGLTQAPRPNTSQNPAMQPQLPPRPPAKDVKRRSDSLASDSLASSVMSLVAKGHTRRGGEKCPVLRFANTLVSLPTPYLPHAVEHVHIEWWMASTCSKHMVLLHVQDENSSSACELRIEFNVSQNGSLPSDPYTLFVELRDGNRAGLRATARHPELFGGEWHHVGCQVNVQTGEAEFIVDGVRLPTTVSASKEQKPSFLQWRPRTYLGAASCATSEPLSSDHCVLPYEGYLCELNFFDGVASPPTLLGRLAMNEGKGCLLKDSMKNGVAQVVGGEWVQTQFPPTAVVFDGMSQYVNVGSCPSFGERLGMVCLEVWVRTSHTGSRMALIKATDPGTGQRFGVTLNSSGEGEFAPHAVCCEVRDTKGNGVTAVATCRGLFDGAWHLLKWHFTASLQNKADQPLDPYASPSDRRLLCDSDGEGEASSCAADTETVLVGPDDLDRMGVSLGLSIDGVLQALHVTFTHKPQPHYTKPKRPVSPLSSSTGASVVPSLTGFERFAPFTVPITIAGHSDGTGVSEYYRGSLRGVSLTIHGGAYANWPLDEGPGATLAFDDYDGTGRKRLGMLNTGEYISHPPLAVEPVNFSSWELGEVPPIKYYAAQRMNLEGFEHNDVHAACIGVDVEANGQNVFSEVLLDVNRNIPFDLNPNGSLPNSVWTPPLAGTNAVRSFFNRTYERTGRGPTEEPAHRAQRSNSQSSTTSIGTEPLSHVMWIITVGDAFLLFADCAEVALPAGCRYDPVTMRYVGPMSSMGVDNKRAAARNKGCSVMEQELSHVGERPALWHRLHRQGLSAPSGSIFADLVLSHVRGERSTPCVTTGSSPSQLYFLHCTATAPHQTIPDSDASVMIGVLTGLLHATQQQAATLIQRQVRRMAAVIRVNQLRMQREQQLRDWEGTKPVGEAHDPPPFKSLNKALLIAPYLPRDNLYPTLEAVHHARDIERLLGEAGFEVSVMDSRSAEPGLRPTRVNVLNRIRELQGRKDGFVFVWVCGRGNAEMALYAPPSESQQRRRVEESESRARADVELEQLAGYRDLLIARLFVLPSEAHVPGRTLSRAPSLQGQHFTRRVSRSNSGRRATLVSFPGSYDDEPRTMTASRKSSLDVSDLPVVRLAGIESEMRYAIRETEFHTRYQIVAHIAEEAEWMRVHMRTAPSPYVFLDDTPLTPALNDVLLVHQLEEMVITAAWDTPQRIVMVDTVGYRGEGGFFALHSNRNGTLAHLRGRYSVQDGCAPSLLASYAVTTLPPGEVTLSILFSHLHHAVAPYAKSVETEGNPANTTLFSITCIPDTTPTPMWAVACVVGDVDVGHHLDLPVLSTAVLPFADIVYPEAPGYSLPTTDFLRRRLRAYFVDMKLAFSVCPCPTWHTVPSEFEGTPPAASRESTALRVEVAGHDAPGDYRWATTEHPHARAFAVRLHRQYLSLVKQEGCPPLQLRQYVVYHLTGDLTSVRTLVWKIRVGEARGEGFAFISGGFFLGPDRDRYSFLSK